MIDTSNIHHLLFKDGQKRQIKFLVDGSVKGYGKTWKLINGIVYVFDSNRFVIGEFNESDVEIKINNTIFINTKIKQPVLMELPNHPIHSAKWGIENNYIDVTEKARQLFDKYERVDAFVENFGDHIKGKRKHLIINDIVIQENISYYMKERILNTLKQWGIKDQKIFNFINNSKQISISKDHVRINIYNEQNICYICSPPNNGVGLYCYVNYYLHALNQANSFKSKILLSTKDGWSLYKNTHDDDLYSNIFSYNASGKNDLEKYFSSSQRVIDTITLLKSKYNIDPTKTIGVMARGTDKATEYTLPVPEQYIDKCNDLLKDNPDHKILLQTDEQPIADLFIQTYGAERVILIDEIPRSSDGKNVFHRELNDKIGLCVYLDAVIRIISECQYVVKTERGNIGGIIDKYRRNNINIYDIHKFSNYDFIETIPDVDVYIKPKLTIAISSCRPNNLIHIIDDIESNNPFDYFDFNINIIIDKLPKDVSKDITNYFDSKSYVKYKINKIQNNFGGHNAKNIIYDQIESGFIYTLDDDNIIYPNFFKSIYKYIVSCPNKKIFVFSQTIHKLNFNYDLNIGFVDTAMYLFDKSICNIKIPLYSGGDGQFIIDLCIKNKSLTQFISETLCNYNNLNFTLL